MSTSPPLWLIADRPTGWLLVLARAASCAVCLRTTFCRSSWERKGHLLRDTHASSCCWGMLTRPPWETLGPSPQVRSPCEVCGFDGVCICCREAACKASLLSFAWWRQKPTPRKSGALQVLYAWFILQEIIFVFLLQEHNRNQSKRVIDTALRINHIFKIKKKFTPCPISC